MKSLLVALAAVVFLLGPVACATHNEGIPMENNREPNPDIAEYLDKHPEKMAALQEYRAFKGSVYIQVPIEKVWQAITTPETVAQFYHMPLLKLDLKVGGDAIYGYNGPQGEVRLQEGKVLALEENRKLVYTFMFSYNREDPEFTKVEDFTSQVTYQLTPYGDNLCQLTVIHDCFQTTDGTFMDISEGWPVILSKLKTLMETGTPLVWPKGGYIGIQPGMAPDALGGHDAKGVYVVQVMEGGPVASGDTPMKDGDLIVEFNGQPLTGYDSFQQVHLQTKPGDAATFVVLRDGKRVTLSVTLGEFPSR